MMIAPAPRADRLLAELEFVTANLDRWRQGVWWDVAPAADRGCGTTACLAGWTLLHAGHEPYLDDRGNVVNDLLLVAPGDGPAADRLVDVHVAARDRLGLSDDQADLLFNPSCTLRDLWEFARVFTGGEVRVPPAVAVLPLETFEPADEGYYATLAAWTETGTGTTS